MPIHGEIVWLDNPVTSRTIKIMEPYTSYLDMMDRTLDVTRSSMIRYPSNGGSGNKLNAKSIKLIETNMDRNGYRSKAVPVGIPKRFNNTIPANPMKANNRLLKGPANETKTPASFGRLK